MARWRASTVLAGIHFSRDKAIGKMGKEISCVYPSTDVKTPLDTLCFLMSRHAENLSQELENIISDHFSIIQSHPDYKSGTLKDLGGRLGFHWHRLAISGRQKNTDLVH